MTIYLHFYKIILNDNKKNNISFWLAHTHAWRRIALKDGAIFDAPCESECEMNSAKSFLMTFVRADCLNKLD